MVDTQVTRPVECAQYKRRVVIPTTTAKPTLRELREAKALTKGQFAAMCGITLSGVSRLENPDRVNGRRPSWNLVKKMAEVLDVDTDTLASCWGIIPPDLVSHIDPAAMRAALTATPTGG